MSLINIKQINNQVAQSDSAIVFDGEKNVWSKIRHHQVISYNELVNGIVIISHGLNRKYVQISIYDENDLMVLPDEIHLVDNDTFEIDLTSYGNHVIGWNIVVT